MTNDMTQALNLSGGQEPPLQAPPKAPSPPGQPTATAQRLAFHVVTTVPLSGLMAWVGGVAAHSGYHLSVPFLPTWLLFIVAAVAAGHFTGLVGAVWHHEKGLTAAQLAAQVRAGELTVEHLAPTVLAQLHP